MERLYKVSAWMAAHITLLVVGVAAFAENMPDAEQMYFLCFLGFRCKTDENMVNFFRFYSIEGSRRQTVPALPRRRTRARGTGRKAESVSGQAKLLLNIAAEAAKIKRRKTP